MGAVQALNKIMATRLRRFSPSRILLFLIAHFAATAKKIEQNFTPLTKISDLNAETIEVLEKTNRGEDLIYYDSYEEFKRDLFN